MMDKKKLLKMLPIDEAKGFEDFIEGQPNDGNFFAKNSSKREYTFEHFTFLTNDSQRLLKLKNVLTEKAPFSSRFDQSAEIIREQKEDIGFMREKIFDVCDQEASPFQQSMAELFDGFFKS
jgi:hypothetical protein